MRSRIDIALRFRHFHHSFSTLQVREEAGCGRSKVGPYWYLEKHVRSLIYHREFQLFLIGYIIVSICEIFTVGGFPLDRKVRLVWHPLQDLSALSV